MFKRSANAIWHGNLEDGEGRIEFGDGRFDESYSAGSRFGDENETNPEELIAAAHAGCFSMALSKALADDGHPAERVQTEATVSIEKDGDGFTITTIELVTEAEVPGIEKDAFVDLAEEVKEGCPVSKVLAGAEIRLEASLV